MKIIEVDIFFLFYGTENNFAGAVLFDSHTKSIGRRSVKPLELR